MTGAWAPLVSDGVGGWLTIVLLGALCVLFGTSSIRQSLEQYRTSKLVENTPTERVRSMAVGRTELTGRAKPYEDTYDQPFEDGECVFGEFWVRELVTKRTNDGKETVWEPVEHGLLGERIVLDDGTGTVALRQPPVDYSDQLVTKRTQGRLANLIEGTFLGDWFGVGPNDATRSFLEERGMSVTASNRRQYEQRVVPPGTGLYVFGQAAIASDDDFEQATLDRLTDRYPDFETDLILQRRPSRGGYVVTDKSESQVASEHFWDAVRDALGGIVLIVVGLVLLSIALFLYLLVSGYWSPV